MARNEYVFNVRVVAVTGFATCDVCSTLVVWTVPYEQLEAFEDGESLRCGTCGGSCHVDYDSVRPVVDCIADGT